VQVRTARTGVRKADAPKAAPAKGAKAGKS